MGPFSDPVREAVGRYRNRFPDTAFALHHDPMTAAMFRMLERALVQADMAMQDEGLDHDQRRRVVSAALYGSVDEDEAASRMADRREKVATLRTQVASLPPVRLDFPS
jgi:hypothetical protein